MKFIAIVCPAFLARVKPVSAMANPACMNMTRKPHTRVQTMLMAIRLCPTVSATLAASGSFSDIVLMSLSVGAPADPPMMSAMPPVATPEGSGFGASAAIAGRTVPATSNRRRQAQHPHRPLPEMSFHHVLLFLYQAGPLRGGRGRGSAPLSGGIRFRLSVDHGKLMSNWIVAVFCPARALLL